MTAVGASEDGRPIAGRVGRTGPRARAGDRRRTSQSHRDAHGDAVTANNTGPTRGQRKRGWTRRSACVRIGGP
ncbi:MAG: hypothetical protein F4X11_24640 [Acidobacteria bacterium]|nr:hypothetical protein [Acidobacteriota bacterium]